MSELESRMAEASKLEMLIQTGCNNCGRRLVSYVDGVHHPRVPAAIVQIGTERVPLCGECLSAAASVAALSAAYRENGNG